MRRILVLLALVPICVSAQLTPEQEAMLERMDEIDRYIYRAPIFLDESSRGGLQATAKLLDESCEDVENPHTDGVLTYCTIQFQGGLELRYRVFGDPQQLHIIWIDIQSSRWVLARDVAVGQSFEQVVKALGDPTIREEERVVYSGVTEQAIFELSDGNVSRIRLKYYAD